MNANRQSDSFTSLEIATRKFQPHSGRHQPYHPATGRPRRDCGCRNNARRAADPAQKGRQTLRFVAEADLRILDPIWTTAYITRNHGYLVYDTLFGTDQNFQVKPQMVDRTTVSPDGMNYTFTLRDGLRWHDGQPVVSEDCVESLKRWGKKDRFGQLLMAHTEKIAPVDNKTFTLDLAERFGPCSTRWESRRATCPS